MDEAIIKAAIMAITEELKQDPRNATLYKERGRLHMMLGHKDEAAKDLHLALMLNPDIQHGIDGQIKG